MKNVILSLLAATAAATCTAQTYTVKGTAPAGVEKVYLYNEEARTTDSVAVSDGNFAFDGEADGKVFATVGSGSTQVPVILDGTVTVDLQAATASGNIENEELTEWNTRISASLKALKQIVENYQGKELSEAEEREASARYNKLEKELNELVTLCCHTNLNRKFPAHFLMQFASIIDKKNMVDWAETGAVFLKTSYTRRIAERIEGWKRQAIGAMVTDFEMADTTGTMRHLTDFVGKGNYVLVDFWASWCGPCRQEMPTVKKAYSTYHAKGFDIVGISFDNNHKAWTGAIESIGLPWNHLSDLQGWNSIGSKIYGINSIPATILFGPEGEVVAIDLRGENLLKKLAEIYR